ncbi:MAG: hypothetical protein M3340_01035 [Actinomycetota bacterium]|nr:hypothetical protein [Actinomycetota bacterium]
MPAHLFLPGLQGNFRVPEREADEIRRKLREAMEAGELVEIETELGDNPLTRPVVTVNGAGLAWFTVIVMDRDPAIT